MLFMTALIYAARLNHAAGGGVAEQVTMLLGAGADGSVKDILGQTAWDHAQNNEKLKDTEAYWMLNYARFK
jgi:ankyrin repeat protein